MPVKCKVENEISQNFVAFSKYMNFTKLCVQMWWLHNLKNSRVAVFQRAEKKGERVYTLLLKQLWKQRKKRAALLLKMKIKQRFFWPEEYRYRQIFVRSSSFCRTWRKHVVYKNCSELSEKNSAHNIFSPGLSLEFSSIELVIQWTMCSHIALWVSWCKNRSFWQRFTGKKI